MRTARTLQALSLSMGNRRPPLQPGPNRQWDVSQDLAIEMVYVPPGDFIMGSNAGEEREKPRHTHHLPQGFYIARCETTWDQYRVFCDAQIHKKPDAPIWNPAGDHPVVNVTWFDAKAFCDFAGLALPTEAQWEKAARGADGREYPWGNNWDGSKCNHGLEKGLQEADPSDGDKYTSPVDRHPAGASPCGALNMAGNVFEWCEDWFDEGAYRRYARGDELPPQTGEKRVFRGGSWFTDRRATRAARRAGSPPEHAVSTMGFRPVKNVED
jgi:formylglycine-generating enzyme required for sulfatase activity